MLVNTGIVLEENDRLDINTIIEIINTSNRMFNEIKGMDSLSEEQVSAYYSGCARALVEAKVSLHLLRKEFSEKYNIPYNFISRNGEILIEEREESE